LKLTKPLSAERLKLFGQYIGENDSCTAVCHGAAPDEFGAALQEHGIEPGVVAPGPDWQPRGRIIPFVIALCVGWCDFVNRSPLVSPANDPRNDTKQRENKSSKMTNASSR
jgi:hypothetical protein